MHGVPTRLRLMSVPGGTARSGSGVGLGAGGGVDVVGGDGDCGCVVVSPGDGAGSPPTGVPMTENWQPANTTATKLKRRMRRGIGIAVRAKSRMISKGGLRKLGRLHPPS